MGSTIDASYGSDPAAIYTTPDSGKNEGDTIYSNENTLSSSAGSAIDSESKQYSINITNGTVSGWKGAAIRANGGIAMVEGTRFTQKLTPGDVHLYLGPDVLSATVMSNTFADASFSMDNHADPSTVWVNNAPFPKGFASLGLTGPSLAALIPPQPKPAKTDPASLFVVTDYGAKGDCATDLSACTDNTAAFEGALDAAGHHGGGTVYIPAGSYLITGHLAVPAGVELVGVNQDQLPSKSADQSFLLAAPAKGDAAPFITLGAHAGVRGFMVYYPGQNDQASCPSGKMCWAPQPFGPTIQAQGPGDWVANMLLSNPTYGIDFATYGSDGHYISDILGYALGTLLQVSKSSSGFIGDYQFSVGQWYIGGGAANIQIPDIPGNPPADKAVQERGAPLDAFAQGNSIVLGSAKNELLVSIFSHAPYNGLKTVADGGEGPSFTLIGFGDETPNAIDLEALDPAGAKIAAGGYHTINNLGYPSEKLGTIAGAPYLIVGSAVAPTTPILFLDFDNSGTPATAGIELAGGTLTIQNYRTNLGGNDAVKKPQWAHVKGAETGLVTVSSRFIKGIPGGTIINDQSPNVIFAGNVFKNGLVTTGPVDLTFQNIPPVSK
jgi:hypothetical protein